MHIEHMTDPVARFAPDTLRIQADEVCEGRGDTLCGAPATCIVEVTTHLLPASGWYSNTLTDVFAACDDCACEEASFQTTEILKVL